MGVKRKRYPSSLPFSEAVEEFTKLYNSLPLRPSNEEVEAAMSVLKTVSSEEQTKLEEISKQEKPHNDVDEELFSMLQAVRRTMVLFQSHEQRKEASDVVELNKMFHSFDDVIQNYSGVVSGDTQDEEVVGLECPFEKIEREAVISDESLVMMKKKKDDEESERDGLKGLAKSASISFSGSMEAGNNAYKGVATASVSSPGSSYNSLAQDNNPKVEKADQHLTDWFTVDYLFQSLENRKKWKKKETAVFYKPIIPFPFNYCPYFPSQHTPEDDELMKQALQEVEEALWSRFKPEVKAERLAFQASLEDHFRELKQMALTLTRL